MSEFRWTLPVADTDEGGDGLVLTPAQVWDGLLLKAEEPGPFVPNIAGSRVLKRFAGGLLREITLRTGPRLREVITFEPGERIVFHQLDDPFLAQIVNEMDVPADGPPTFTIRVVPRAVAEVPGSAEQAGARRTAALIGGTIGPIVDSMLDQERERLAARGDRAQRPERSERSERPKRFALDGSGFGPDPVLDFHVRLAPDAEAPSRLLAAMDESRITRAVVCAGGTLPLEQLSRQVIEGGGITTDADNDAVLSACERSGGRLVPFFFANPHRDAEHYAKRGADFAGVEISPAVHDVPLTDDRVDALVRAARALGHCVYTVCLPRAGCQVSDLVALARRHPEVTFVLGHAGVSLIDLHAVELLAGQPNVLLETSGGYVLVTREAVRRLGPSRVLLGSEYPLQHPELEVDKIRYCDLDRDAWRQVVWGNAHRVLGLPEPA